MDQKELSAFLHDLSIVDVHGYDQLPSTNIAALAWLYQHPHEYAVVATDWQTAGYGRHKRHWFSQPGASLTFSFILYPNQNEQAVLPLFSALTCLSICDAITPFNDDQRVEIKIKWPNDVLLNKKKVAGILLEAVWQESMLLGLVIGVGVNVQSASLPPNEELMFPATTLEDAFAKSIDRWQLLHDILRSFMQRRKTFLSFEFMQDWRKKLAYMGEEITIMENEKEAHRGTFMGVGKLGQLQLKEKNGSISVFPLGDVSLRPPNP